MCRYSNEKKRDLKFEPSCKNISDTKVIENSDLSHDEDENFSELIIDETNNTGNLFSYFYSKFYQMHLFF